MNTAEDYNAELRNTYEELRAKVERGELPLDERIKAVDEAVTAYVTAQDADFAAKRAKAIAEGRSPNTVPIQLRDSWALHRMADLLMYEYLTWSHHDKINIVDNPILSDTQANYRRRREAPLADVYTGKNDVTIGRQRGHDGIKRRIYDYMTPERDMAPSPAKHIDLHAAIDRAGLTNRQRQAISLVYFEGLTQAAAAERMGVSRRTLRSTIGDAMAKIIAEISRH